MKISTVIFVISVVVAAGCAKKKVPVTEIYGKEYYPLTQNKFIIYDVDSIIYTEIPKDSTHYKYRIKEKIADSFTDNLGKPAIRLERYIKKYNPNISYDSLPWTMKEVWQVSVNEYHIQVVEANVRYTKLVFPVSERTSWNGNAGNTLGEQIYMYNYFDRAETINGTILENVLSIKQHEFRTLISYDNYAEKYAKGIGLVYREIDNLLSNNIVPGVPVENRIESGLIYKQTLVTYGYE